MKRLCSAPRLATVAALLFCQAALAHGPVFDCYFEDTSEVKCEAGFTDGSSAAGRKIRVQDASNKVLIEGVVSQDNTFAFEPPAGSYSVLFLGGDGHDVTLQSSDISR